MTEREPRILLVDDEAAITSKLAPFLERAGFMVDVADNGEAALQRVASFAPDLMILDVLMPKLDGREVCRRLRAAGNMAMGLVAAWGVAKRQRRVLEEERNRAAEAHRRFVQRLNHELKNPLTAMRLPDGRVQSRYTRLPDCDQLAIRSPSRRLVLSPTDDLGEPTGRRSPVFSTQTVSHPVATRQT